LLPRRLLVLSALAATVFWAPGLGHATRPGDRLVYVRGSAVWLAAADGTGARRVLKGAAPAISPDGRWIAFLRCRELAGDCGSVHLISASGARARVLLRGGHLLPYQPSWSPDSRRLVVRGRRSLLLFDTGGGIRMLARGGIFGVAFSPNGRSVVYGRGPSLSLTRTDLYVAATTERAGGRLTTDGRSAYPAWGPTRIAFVRWRWRRGWPANELWTMRPDGDNRRLLTNRPRPSPGALGLEPVEWSGDGCRLLAGFATELGGFAPYAVDVRTGRTRALPTAGLRAAAARLSRDGRHALVVGSVFDVNGSERVLEVGWNGGVRVLARRAYWADWTR
jgi:hypothetical protein